MGDILQIRESIALYYSLRDRTLHNRKYIAISCVTYVAYKYAGIRVTRHMYADSISKFNLYCSIVIIKATNIFGQIKNQNMKQCSLIIYKNDITSIPKHFWMNRSEFKFWCDCWLAHLTLDKIDQRFVWSHDVSFENAITFSHVISVQIVTDNVRRIDVIFWGCCPHDSIAYKTRIRIRFGFIDENPVDWQLNKDARIFTNYYFLYFK